MVHAILKASRDLIQHIKSDSSAYYLNTLPGYQVYFKAYADLTLQSTGRYETSALVFCVEISLASCRLCELAAIPNRTTSICSEQQ